MAASSVDSLNSFAEIQPILHNVEKLGSWIVVVCPNQNIASQYAQLIAGGLPVDARFSGRTGICAGGGKITVVSLDDPLIDGNYMIAYLGWGSKLQRTNGVSPWLTTTLKLFKAGNLA